MYGPPQQQEPAWMVHPNSQESQSPLPSSETANFTYGPPQQQEEISKYI